MLEQELLLLRTRLAKPDVIRETQVVFTFTKKDFGNWDAAELADVIYKLMGDDLKPNKDENKLSMLVGKDGFDVSGSSEYIANFTAWVKKLKK